MTRFQRFREVYTELALQAFNFFVIFAIVNVAMLISFRWLDKPPAPPPPTPVVGLKSRPPVIPRDPEAGRPTPNKVRDKDTLEQADMAAYDGVSQAEAEEVVDDWNRLARLGFVYAPWVGFAPAEFHSRLLNVDVPLAPPGTTPTVPDKAIPQTEFAARRSLPPADVQVAADAPEFVVVVMGGSTVWGSRLTDAWTIPSALWRELQQKAGPQVRIKVINYGRQFFYSSQEVMLFLRLLRARQKVDMVIFLDGLNEVMQACGNGGDRPMLTDRMAKMFHDNQLGKDWLAQYGWLPIVRFAFLMKGITKHKAQPPSGSPQTLEDVERKVDEVLSTYRENQAVAMDAARRHGIAAYFFWQPTPFYRYDPTLHRVFPNIPPTWWEVFERVHEQVARGALPHTIDIAGIIPEFGKDRKVFVDQVHYNPSFINFMAKRMAGHIDIKR